MKTIYILAVIILLGASVFTYVYNRETKKPAEISKTDSLKAPGLNKLKMPVSTAQGINPAHGLPGHRCDLPVGAPLTITSAQKSSAPALPKINPQHGMPGHRCDLAVGASL